MEELKQPDSPQLEEQKPPTSRWDTESLGPEERQILIDADNDPAALITTTGTASKLGLFSTCCIVINRMIGTGIYSIPSTVLNATDSPAGVLFLWAAGFIISWAGLMVYIEFGLSIPRYRDDDGVKQPVPRSGGEKNYLEYVYRAPRYLATCVYGVVFIVLGNTAGNAIAFAEAVLQAQGGYDLINPDQKTQWLVKGVAITAVTGACLLHGSWRAGGIVINNIFATIKICTLVVLIVVGLIYSAQHPSTHNLDPKFSFQSDIQGGSMGKLYNYSQSLLLVMFTYGGFENANFILSEIEQPRKTFKRATMLSLLLVSTLYMLANIVYFLVLPVAEMKTKDALLGLWFFNFVSGGSAKATRAAATFIAFSSFGNIVVVTFVGSRVKQEIAKEGILPWSRFFASDVQTPFSWFRNRLRRSANISPSDQESTPLAALGLHWIFSIVLVIAPSVGDAYLTLLLLHSYALHIWVGFFLGAGLLYLYLKPGSTWKSKSGFTPLGSWVWAAIFALANLLMIIIPWIPPHPAGQFKLILLHTKYYVYPAVTVGLLVAGVAYWVMFTKIYPQIHHRELTVNRIPIIRDGVQIHEAVFFNWVIPSSVEDEDQE